jgi:hypothetical protein
VRKLWCTGVIAGGMLLLGAAPAWADHTPAAASETAHRPAGRAHSPGARPIAPRVERGQVDYPFLGGLAGSMPVIAYRVTDVHSEFAGMPFGGLPLRPGQSVLLLPDDGSEPVPAPVGPDALIDPATLGNSTTPAGPAAVADPDTPADPDAVDSAPTAAPTAGVGSVSAPPPAGTPDTAAPRPSASTPRGFAAEQKPKAPALPSVDDPRLLEEPVDGFVNREKWKR